MAFGKGWCAKTEAIGPLPLLWLGALDGFDAAGAYGMLGFILDKARGFFGWKPR
jgi:hypothetical protein